MKYSVKKKVATVASVACVSLLMAACGSEAPDQAAVEDALQEGTEAAGEAIDGAAADAEELVKSQEGAIEGAMDEAGEAAGDAMDAVGERVEQPASFDGAADQVEGAADAAGEAGTEQSLESTLDDAKKRLDSAQEEIQGAQE